MTYSEAMDVLGKFVADGRATPAQRQAKDALEAVAAEVDLIRRRYADKEAVRLGHIVRHALTPEQYYVAEQAARLEHPDAWEGRIPAVWAAQQEDIGA